MCKFCKVVQHRIVSSQTLCSSVFPQTNSPTISQPVCAILLTLIQVVACSSIQQGDRVREFDFGSSCLFLVGFGPRPPCRLLLHLRPRFQLLSATLLRMLEPLRGAQTPDCGHLSQQFAVICCHASKTQGTMAVAILSTNLSFSPLRILNGKLLVYNFPIGLPGVLKRDPLKAKQAGTEGRQKKIL